MSWRLKFALLLATQFCWAAGTEIAGPLSGVLFDAPAKSLRRVVGVMGNAYVGAAVATELDWAQAGPQARLGFAVREGQLFAVSGLLTEPHWQALSLPIESRPLAWSPDGSEALLLNSADGAIERVWLAESEIRTEALTIPGDGKVLAAVLLNGHVAIFSRQNGETGDVWLWSAGQFSAVPGLSRITNLTLAAEGDHAYALEAETSTLVKLRVSAGQLETSRLRTLEGGAPAQLVVEANARAIYSLKTAVDGAAFERWAFEGDEHFRVDLEVLPERFASGPSSRYRLLEYARKAGEPFYFLDLTDGSTIFIPAGANQ